MSAFGKIPVKLYTSGPIRGYEDFLARFEDAKMALTTHGFLVISPPDIEPCNARGETLDPTVATYGDFLRSDLLAMLTCDAVATLDGWQDSKGANREVETARDLGMLVMPVRRWLQRFPTNRKGVDGL